MHKKNQEPKIFFHGLNEIRGLAALAVIWHHIELYKFREGIPSLYDFPYVRNPIHRLGENGVLLFFSLSGFLITFLLLKELESLGKINFKKFYIRRILRIWPLYYLSVIIGFALLPAIYSLSPSFFASQGYAREIIHHLVYEWNLLLYLFMLSNICLGLYPVFGASQNWSVSVEEQFYVIWPLLISIFKKQLPYFLLITVILLPLTRTWILGNLTNEQFPWLRSFFFTFQIDFMAMGGLTAYLYHRFPKAIEKWVGTIWVPIICILIGGYYLYFPEGIRIFKSLAFSGLLISAVVWKIRIPILDHVGQVSYGLYMLHPVPILLTITVLENLRLSPETIHYLSYPIILGLSYGVSRISYRYFEQPFLKRKEKFMVVASTNRES